VIAALQRSESHEETREKLGIPLNKVVVTCGYNASRAQQHAVMVDALAMISPIVKSRIFVIVPMTYPNDPIYRQEVKSFLGSAKIEYRIEDTKLSVEDNCRVRIASDYAVNVQTTDSLSASLQEHMFAGSSMIVGRWLPYDVLEKMGVRLHKVENAKEIAATLEREIRASQGHRIRPEYSDKLYDYSSWTSNGPRWLALYGGNESNVRAWDYGALNNLGWNERALDRQR
jgi:hypothetical protein